MIGKSLLVLLWFPLTLSLLVLNLTLLSYSSRVTQEQLSALPPNEMQAQFASAGTSQILGATITAGDARTLLLSSFLEKNKSPMAPYANLIVSEADKNDIDFRLVPAIAMCESNLGKHMPKKNEYNFAGIAVYTGQIEGKAFDSWEHAIEWVSSYIKSRYYDRGLVTLQDIGAVWAPPSVAKGHSWANCVGEFQSSIL